MLQETRDLLEAVETVRKNVPMTPAVYVEGQFVEFFWKGIVDDLKQVEDKLYRRLAYEEREAISRNKA